LIKITGLITGFKSLTISLITGFNITNNQNHISFNHIFTPLKSAAKDSATALGIINMFLISGGGLLGIGVFETKFNKF
jgi:hypothetical protein